MCSAFFKMMSAMWDVSPFTVCKLEKQGVQKWNMCVVCLFIYQSKNMWNIQSFVRTMKKYEWQHTTVSVIWQTGIWIPVLPFINGENCKKLLSLSESQFSSPVNGDKNNIHSLTLQRRTDNYSIALQRAWCTSVCNKYTDFDEDNNMMQFLPS